MQASWGSKLTLCLRLATCPLLAAVVFFWSLGPAVAIECTDYGVYNLKITNDTADNPTKYNIFPVITTPTNGPDEWLQAAFNVPVADLGTRKYGHDKVYLIYIKPLVGLAPGESVTVSLPVCSRLVPATPTSPIGKVNDEYIDWWNGGRVYIFDSPLGSGPPAALTAEFQRDSVPANVVTPLDGVRPTRAGCPLSNPPIYKSNVLLAAND